MKTKHTISTQQIGRLGELMVQCKLLAFGVESALLTTDSGVDLVAYSRKNKTARTIQVKTNLKPKTTGGKGKGSTVLNWSVEEKSPAELFAFVDVSENRAWFFTKNELKECASLRSNGDFELYMYLDPSAKPKGRQEFVRVYEFERFRIENRIDKFF